MTVLILCRRFLADYTRNPVNLLLLAVVPVVFVIVVAGSLADTAKLLGGVGGPAVETAAAGWAAAFLAGIAMYFQTAATRATDRRLVFAGLSTSRLVLARLLTGVTLAVLASAAALAALWVRTGIDHPARAVLGTVMFAVMYVAVGSVVGALARNPINGTVIVLFVWILDVFFGPAMGAADRVATRAFPTHFVTLWMVDLPSRHGGQIGDLGWAVTATLIAGLASWGIVAARSRSARPHPRRPVGWRGQLAAAYRAAWIDARRNPVQWVLFILVPAVFILGAAAVTPDKPIPITVVEQGRQIIQIFDMPQVHAATMAPIAVASLAALVGLFVMLDSTKGDRRAAVAGLAPTTLLTARLGVLALAAVAGTAVALAVTAVVFHPAQWPGYAAANILIALTYGLIGALLAPIVGRIGGVFIAFLLPFLDLAIVQSPMLHPTPTVLSTLLPGSGGSRVLLDTALTPGFDETRPLLIGLAWLTVLTAAVTLTYRHTIQPAPVTVQPPALRKSRARVLAVRPPSHPRPAFGRHANNQPQMSSADARRPAITAPSVFTMPDRT